MEQLVVSCRYLSILCKYHDKKMEVMPVSDIFYSNIIMKLIMKLYPNVCTLKTMALLVSLENHLQTVFLS